jgi:MFS family permease
VPVIKLFTSSRGGAGGGRLVVYLLAMQTAVQISGPYFAPYMLVQQKLSYLTYMLLIGLAYFGKVVALPLWGRVAHVGGARRLLWIGGTAIIPVAGLWLGADIFSSWQTSLPIRIGSFATPIELSAEIAYLAGVQFISGFVWAAYELAMQLMFFEAIPRCRRPSMLSYYNFGNAAAQVTGGLIGATILQLGQENHGAYLALFGVSSLMRLCTVPLLAQMRERPVEGPLRAELVAG